MDIADIFQICRRGTPVDFKSPFAVAEFRLSTDNPRVAVAEDAGIFLVARRITADFAQFQTITGISGLQYHDAVRGFQVFLYALKGKGGLAALFADARHDTHALWFNEDFAFLAFTPADDIAEGIIGPAEPGTVPAGIQNSGFHGCNDSLTVSGFLFQPHVTADFSIGTAVFDKHAGNENAFSDRAFAGACGLEAFTRVFGKAVQIQAVVPVGTADQRQVVGTEVCDGIAETAAQMFHQRLRCARVAVEGAGLFQDAPVAGLAQVGVGAGNQP